MPAGKAIAIAAMPTAVLMGMGFTPTLALADGNDAAPPSNSLTADEYKDCVAALEDAEKDPSASPTPSPSATDGADEGKDDAKEPDPSASTGDTGEDAGTDAGSDQGDPSSSDSGSDDKGAEDEQDAPAPSPSASQSQEASGAGAAEPSPSESEDKGGLLDGLGDAIEGIFTGGKKAEESPSPTPTPSASEGAGDASDALKDTTGTVTDTAKDTVEGATDTASKAAEDTADTVDKAAEAAKEAARKAKEDAAKAKEDAATATPSPSASESADEAAKDAEDCPAATDAEGGVDNKLPLPDDPWYLNASSLLLKGASYKGVVEVRTANGTTKKVLKYVISNGTDIGDLHQTVKDEQAGKTYHVQAAKGSTSTIRDGETVMYTESISGNLLGLIPITFDPENPPPLDIPLIYFTKVTVVQAGQFGGTLHVPGLHQYTT
jgi:gas vesicle protein